MLEFTIAMANEFKLKTKIVLISNPLTFFQTASQHTHLANKKQKKTWKYEVIQAHCTFRYRLSSLKKHMSEITWLGTWSLSICLINY